MTAIETKFQTLTSYVEGELSDLARNYFYQNSAANSVKYDGSVVTDIDLAIERQLRSHILELFSDDSIYGEEDGLVSGTSGFVWIIDPIDGTDNFVRKIPFFAITAARVGSVEEGSFAVIHNPISRQTFSTQGGQALYENGEIRSSLAHPVGSRLLITVSGSSTSGEWVSPARQNLSRALYQEFGKSGHYHSSLLEYAFVSVGRIDGFLQLMANAWDQVAGLLLVRAGGGSVSVWREGKWELYDGPIISLYGDDIQSRPTVLVTRPEIHQRVVTFVGDPEKWAESH